MKKIIFLLTGVFLFINTAQSQIDDRAVIPVAITLNSILRLTVTSGGNIEFNFNTLEDYRFGILTSPRYRTEFNVASSVNWNVYMYSENGTLIGTDIIQEGGNTFNTMPLDNIGFHVLPAAGATPDVEYPLTFSSSDPDNPVPLTSNENAIIVGYDGTNSNAGDIRTNSFAIQWECGTARGNMFDEPILDQNLAADRYVTNVFLILQPAN